jgi:hypothetical protein
MKRRESATMAVIAGMAAGGLGIGLYLRSFVDFILITSVALLAVVSAVMTLGPEAVGLGSLIGSLAAAYYGFHRVRASSRRLAAAA